MCDEGHTSGILVAVGTTPFGPPTTQTYSQPGYKVVHHAGGFANIMTLSISDGTCPRFVAALLHFQQHRTSASIRIATHRVSYRSCYLAGGLVYHVNPLSIPRFCSEQVTHHAGKHCFSYRDVTPPLTSHRRRQYVPHSLVIVAGLNVANAFREAHVACMRSQVALVKLLRKGSSDAK